MLKKIKVSCNLITNSFNMFIPAHNIIEVNSNIFVVDKFGIIVPSISTVRDKGVFLLEIINVLQFGRLGIMSFLRHQSDAEFPESESVFRYLQYVYLTLIW